MRRNSCVRSKDTELLNLAFVLQFHPLHENRAMKVDALDMMCPAPSHGRPMDWMTYFNAGASPPHERQMFECAVGYRWVRPVVVFGMSWTFTFDGSMLHPHRTRHAQHQPPVLHRLWFAGSIPLLAFLSSVIVGSVPHDHDCLPGGEPSRAKEHQLGPLGWDASPPTDADVTLHHAKRLCLDPRHNETFDCTRWPASGAGAMPRHSKNAGGMGAEALTYHERLSLGFGTVRARLGKDAQGGFDDCNLSLQPAGDNAVVTPKGVVYAKELLLKNLLRQKKEAAKRLEKWEAQQREKVELEVQRKMDEQDRKAEAFDAKNATGTMPATEEMEPSRSGASRSLATSYQKERIGEAQAFWVPSAVNVLEKREQERPSMDTFCPATGEKLRMKDLVDINWTKVGAGEQGRYKCPVCGDIFSNASVLVCLKPTGNVLHKRCYDQFVKPEGAFEGKRIRDKKDIIHMQKGGTGFAAHEGERLVSQSYNELGVHGLSDELRHPHTR